MKNLIIFALLLLISNLLISQSLSDTITIYKKKKFYQDLHQLSQSELLQIMKNDTEAYAYMKKAKDISSAATAVFIAGASVAIGGTVIDDMSTKLLVCGIGLGIEVVGVLIATGAKPNRLKAVNIYNNNLRKMNKPVSYQLKTGLTKYGMALILTF